VRSTVSLKSVALHAPHLLWGESLVPSVSFLGSSAPQVLFLVCCEELRKSSPLRCSSSGTSYLTVEAKRSRERRASICADWRILSEIGLIDHRIAMCEVEALNGTPNLTRTGP